jgi:hypothetical protein
MVPEGGLEPQLLSEEDFGFLDTPKSYDRNNTYLQTTLNSIFNSN